MSLRDKKRKRRKIEYDFNDVKRALLRKFLYSADSDSIQILLNIYNLEERIENIFPSYISAKTLRADIYNFLSYKEGKELIALNLSQLVHDDVNRFELFMYLEGYRRGIKASEDANELEILTFNYFTVEELYKKNILFHYEHEIKDVLEFKERILNKLCKNIEFSRFLIDELSWYNRRVLKKKILTLNTNVDRQLMIDYDSKENESGTRFKESDSHLNQKELYLLNKRLLNFLYKDSCRVYGTAYWNGINDLVLRRYHS